MRYVDGCRWLFRNCEVVEFVMDAIAERDAEGNIVSSVAAFSERVGHAWTERHCRQLYKHTPRCVKPLGSTNG